MSQTDYFVDSKGETRNGKLSNAHEFIYGMKGYYGTFGLDVQFTIGLQINFTEPPKL